MNADLNYEPGNLETSGEGDRCEDRTLVAGIHKMSELLSTAGPCSSDSHPTVEA